MIKTIEKLSYRHSTWQVFNDFLEISASAVSNRIDKTNFEIRENNVVEIFKRYDANEIDMFIDMYRKLVMELDKQTQLGELRDVLGELFHALNLHNRWRGQFFTPHTVANTMAEMTITDCDKIIKNKGYITVGEPACGSGVMILGVANSLKKQGFNYQKHMLVQATDIDLKCVHMAYIQFSLYGIPAVVIHGNTLTMEEWSRWYTPMYAWNRVNGRLREVAM